VPVIYQTFSRREINISLLDARAGSPPSAPALLIRQYHGQNPDELLLFLREWERWCAELLESHLSYPPLVYYRSQHENQSWLTALTALLDTCALILVGIEGVPTKPAMFLFAIARHAAVDLAQSFWLRPVPARRRSRSDDFSHLRSALASYGIVLATGDEAGTRFNELRTLYEPFVETMAEFLLVQLPDLDVVANRVDAWQTSTWDHLLDSSPRPLDRDMRHG
jgi:hypothetical protein